MQSLYGVTFQSGKFAHRGDGRRLIVHSDKKLSAFVELEHEVLTVTFYLESNSVTVIEIRSHRWDWKAFEPGVESVFPEKHQAIDYAQNRACFRSGEVRILDSIGNVEQIIPFDDANRNL